LRGRFRQRERGTVARPRAPAPGRAEEKPELHTTPRLSQHTEASEGLTAYASRAPTVCTICRQTVCSLLATPKRGCTKTGSNHRCKTHAPGDCAAEHALDAHFSSVPPQLLSHGPFPSPANRKHGCATDAIGARKLKPTEQDRRNGRAQIRATGQQQAREALSCGSIAIQSLRTSHSGRRRTVHRHCLDTKRANQEVLQVTSSHDVSFSTAVRQSLCGNFRPLLILPPSPQLEGPPR